MKLQPDDPRLSAWLLGELPAEEADAVERAIAADPALLAEVESLSGVAKVLHSAFAAPAAAPGLRPEQREAVREQLRAGLPTSAPVVAFPARPAPARQRRWPLVLAAAAAVACGFFLLHQRSAPEPAEEVAEVTTPSGEEDPDLQPLSVPRISPAPPSASAMPGSARARLAHGLQGGEPTVFVDEASRRLVNPSLPDALQLPPTQALPPLREATSVELPLVIGQASYDWVRGWIREKNELPPRDAVRIEELANAFPLPPEEEIADFAGLRVACLATVSPWSEANRLVGVQIANESGRDRTVEWSFRPSAGAGLGGVRVLASTDGGGKGRSATMLPAGRRTLVLIELAAPKSDADEPGDLVVASDGRSRRFPAKESKEGGLQQAGLVAAFGMWLRGEGVDDHRLTEMLAKAETADPDPARADSRKLMREALGLAERRRR